MGDKVALFQPSFNGSLHVESRGERISSDSGAIVLREIDERLGMVEWLVERIEDPRDQDHVIHPMSDLLRTRLFLLSQGKKDQDDADQHRDDPAFRLSVSERRGVAPLQAPRKDEDTNEALDPDGLASQPTMSRLTKTLGSDENRSTLREGLAEGARRRILTESKGRRKQSLGIDVDSIPIEVYGSQPGSAYNGYYKATVYHPIVASVAETGDILDVQLREGQVHTADGALGFITDVLDKVEGHLCVRAFVRIDAGFPEDELLSSLEARGTRYVARIKKNEVLNRMAEPYLKRPSGRPPKEPRMWFHEMTYKAKEWTKARRVVLVVKEVPGELFPECFWLLTNWKKGKKSGEDLLALYRERGTAEGHQGEFKDVLAPALSSSPRPNSTYKGKLPRRVSPSVDGFAQNEATLFLNALAYNLSHAGRVLVEKATGKGWSLKRFRERVLLVAGRFTLHSNQVTMVIARTAARIWQQLWERLRRFEFVAT